MKEKGGGQHTRSRIGIIEKNPTIGLDETINTGVGIEFQILEQLRASRANAFNGRFGQIDGRTFAGEACQIFGAVVKDFLAFEDFGRREG